MSSPARTVSLTAGRAHLVRMARALFGNDGVRGIELDGDARVVVSVTGDDGARAVVRWATRHGVKVRHVRSYSGDEVDL